MDAYNEIEDMRYKLSGYWVGSITKDASDAVTIYRTIRNGVTDGGVSHPVVRLINEDMRAGV